MNLPSPTGSAGMEAGFCNFLEPGDVAVIGVGGFFAERMVENALRCGAEVVRVDTEWGRIVEPEAIEAALKSQKKVKLLALVHAETSTGVLQPLVEASRLAKQYEALLLVDAVTSLGGHELAVDDWGIDIVYSCSQKCIGAPPGLSPFTASQAALATMQTRRHKVPSWYLDLSLLSAYWSGSRLYHHTVPISMFYSLHQALASGVDDLAVRKGLLNDFSIEIGGGLGPLKGQVWRIGLMGYSSSPENVLLLLFALEQQLLAQGYPVQTGIGVTAAIEALKK